jgi:hypothetical protein
MNGDVNADGQFTIADVIDALRVAVGLIPATPERLAAADVLQQCTTSFAGQAYRSAQQRCVGFIDFVLISSRERARFDH